jgi:hypothetical protein
MFVKLDNDHEFVIDSLDDSKSTLSGALNAVLASCLTDFRVTQMRWSPTGRFLEFSANNANRSQIQHTVIDTENPQNLITRTYVNVEKERSWMAVFSPDDPWCGYLEAIGRFRRKMHLLTLSSSTWKLVFPDITQIIPHPFDSSICLLNNGTTVTRMVNFVLDRSCSSQCAKNVIKWSMRSQDTDTR